MNVDVSEVRKALYQLDMMRGRANVSPEAFRRWERRFVAACADVADQAPSERRFLAALDRLEAAASL